MLKPIATMTDHEMLVELLQEKRRNDRMKNIKYAILGAVLVILIILAAKYLPPVIRYFRSVQETLQQIQASVSQVQNLTDSVKESVSGLLEKIGGLFHW
jgi:uncharacterized protein YoxC